MKPDEIKTVQGIDNFYPLLDGVINTVNQYAAIMTKTADTAVVAPVEEPFDDSSLPYTIFRSRALRFSFSEYTVPVPKADRNLKKFLDSREIDLIHVHSPFFIGEYLMEYGKKKGIPVVASFHSKYYDDALNATGNKAIAYLMSQRVARFYEKADAVFACSEGTGKTLVSYGFKGTYSVMNNGSSLKYPEHPDALILRAREAFHIEPGKKTILFVGHLIWHKNLKLILDSFKEFAKARPEYRLLIAGEGYDEAAIRKYAESLDFPEGQIRFLGKISDRDLLSGVYLLSDLFFFPSVYDNSPLVVREAASLGLPALLTAGSNAAEAVEHNVSGFTAEETTDGMVRELERIFASPGLLKTVGARARIDVPRSWEEIVSEVRDKYAQINENYQPK